jgi:hypothetical protein
VALTCNPCYSGGSDQENPQFEASRANSSPDLVSKKKKKLQKKKVKGLVE